MVDSSDTAMRNSRYDDLNGTSFRNRIVHTNVTDRQLERESSLFSDIHDDSLSSEPCRFKEPDNIGAAVQFRQFAWNPSHSFRAIRKWEGYVLEIHEDSFSARLVPLKGDDEELEAEIYIEELSEQDRELLQPGAVFYWSIGYHDRPSGRERSSIIRFRRLPVWSRRELEAASAGIDELKAAFDVTDS
jgi:hypothetical protein